jgi:hypothetical protein
MNKEYLTELNRIETLAGLNESKLHEISVDGIKSTINKGLNMIGKGNFDTDAPITIPMKAIISDMIRHGKNSAIDIDMDDIIHWAEKIYKRKFDDEQSKQQLAKYVRSKKFKQQLVLVLAFALLSNENINELVDRGFYTKGGAGESGLGKLFPAGLF